MAFGVLPPYSPLLVTKAFLDALTSLDIATVSFKSVSYAPCPYAFAEQAIKTDNKEPLCEKSFTILGTAAKNQIEVPASVADAYLHALRVFQGIMYSYNWPYTQSSVHEVLEDDEHNVLALLLGLMYDLPGASHCFEKMKLAGLCTEDSLPWEAEVLGELQPVIENIKYALGEIIRADCKNASTNIGGAHAYMNVLECFERLFVTDAMN